MVDPLQANAEKGDCGEESDSAGFTDPLGTVMLLLLMSPVVQSVGNIIDEINCNVVNMC